MANEELDTQSNQDNTPAYTPLSPRGWAASSEDLASYSRRRRAAGASGWSQKGRRKRTQWQEDGDPLQQWTRVNTQQHSRLSLVKTIIAGLIALVVVGGLAFGAYRIFTGEGVFGFFVRGVESASWATAGNPVEITIAEGASPSEIATTLAEQGVVKNSAVFRETVRGQKADAKLQAGSYLDGQFTTGMTDEQALAVLIKGPGGGLATAYRLTIPEGWTIAQTAARVEEVCKIPAADFIAEASNGQKYVPDYDFLAGLPEGASLEGYLYPKTYDIAFNATAEDVVRVLLNQFGVEIANAGVDFSAAEARGVTPYQVIIVASMIERETYTPEERPLVASVIYNRLADGMPLQICATVVYALGDSDRDYGVNPLLYVDLEVDSPYNTYTNTGLPPGPICSPYITSIQAAAAPADTTYYWYVLTSTDGTHTFCSSEDEFWAANEVYNQVFGQ